MMEQVLPIKILTSDDPINIPAPKHRDGVTTIFPNEAVERSVPR